MQLNSVLLVDDSVPTNVFNKKMLQRLNLAKEVITTEDGREALDYLRHENTIAPDLIFLDINMPGMSGWEFLQAFSDILAKRQSHTKVIVISSSADLDDKQQALSKDHVVDYLIKPLFTADLQNAVAKTLASVSAF